VIVVLESRNTIRYGRVWRFGRVSPFGRVSRFWRVWRLRDRASRATQLAVCSARRWARLLLRPLS